jgi:2-phosphosulfolactate phosphatase
MGKIHLLMRKEEIDEQKLNDHKLVVVFDILLATSTITSVLEFGAKEVIPVMDQKEANQLAKERSRDEYILIGEYEGKTIDGFLSPNPIALKGLVSSKSIILSTTNGTVALKKSKNAKSVYAASILNSKAVSEHIGKSYQDESILLVCSGSSGQFNMEDFYGAGYFIDCLLKESINLELTDAAKSAHLFYTLGLHKENEILADSSVGNMLIEYGYEEELKFISNKSIFNVVPIFKNESLIDVNKLRKRERETL